MHTTLTSTDGSFDDSLRFLSAEQGNPTCAHLLGFKFAWHLNDTSYAETPYELYLTAALLIRYRLVRTADLWPHVYSEQALKDAQAAYTKRLEEKIAEAGSNPLTMAGALLDEDEGSGAKESEEDKLKKRKEEEEKEKAASRLPQLVGLTKAFAAVGMMQHASMVIARWPWLLGKEEDLAVLYCRLLRPTVRSAYQLLVPAAANEKGKLSSEGNLMPSIPPKWDVKKQSMVPGARAPAQITTLAPPPPQEATRRFAFFYSGWRDLLRTYTTPEEATQHLPDHLRLIGFYLYHDPKLFFQVARITAAGFAANPTFDAKGRNVWIDVLRTHLFPACSLSDPNMDFLAELWRTLSQLPYPRRYALYGEWKYSMYRRKELKHCQALTEKEAKGILKRISSDIKQQRNIGRKLAKAAHANPTIFLTVALNQVQVYDNMIGPIVEAAGRLGVLENDIFTWTLIDSLSNPEKQRMKKDGTNIASWLKSLSAFAGTLYKRYSGIDSGPLLQYIVNQLSKNNVNDLIIMRELILKMTGIEPLTNPSDKQIAASSGGKALRREATIANDGAQGSVARREYQRNGERMLSTVNQSGMMLPMLILMAQQRDACIDLIEDDDDAHLKFLGTLFDTCQEVLFQYVEFLATYLDAETYERLLPNVDALIERFQLQPDVAFHISRPQLSLKVRRAERQARSERLRKQALASKAAAAKREESKEEVKIENAADDAKKETQTEADVEMTDADPKQDGTADVEMAEPEKPAVVVVEEEPRWWDEALEPVRKALERSLPEAIQNAAVSSSFYLAFWQLSLPDFDVPIQRYKQEIKTLTTQATQAKSVAPGQRMTIEAEAIYRRLSDAIKTIDAELKEQQASAEMTLERVNKDKDTWFGVGVAPDDFAFALLEHCILPRALLGPTDAIYGAKIIRLLHSCATPNFPTHAVYAKVSDEPPCDPLAADVFADRWLVSCLRVLLLSGRRFSLLPRSKLGTLVSHGLTSQTAGRIKALTVLPLQRDSCTRSCATLSRGERVSRRTRRKRSAEIESASFARKTARVSQVR